MAGPTRAGGHPDYSSTGTIGFIPAIWSANMAPKFYEATVFGAVANTNWEGEIKNMGDVVEIRVIPDIAVTDYTVGGGINYQKPSSTKIEMAVDQAISFGFEVADVDGYQSDLKLMTRFSEDASEQMKIAVDRRVLGYTGNGFAGASDANIASSNKGLTAGAISANIDLGTSGTPESITSATILDYIVDMGVVLDETNIPETGRWLILPAWACGLIKKSDLKDASLSGDGTSILRNGRIGMIDRFEVYRSNNLPTASTYTKIYAGHSEGLAFASQIAKVENLRNPNDFGDLVRGLNIFGDQVVNSEALAVGYVAKG
jgi:hypothetical protein